jgi:hypothetical protein
MARRSVLRKLVEVHLGDQLEQTAALARHAIREGDLALAGC